MKDTRHKITVRMSAAEKKLLDELALKTGFSINKTVLESVSKTNLSHDIKSEINSLKDHLNVVISSINYLSENSSKQAKAITAMVEVFKARGLV